MDYSEAKHRIEELKAVLLENSRKYYVENAPTMSDYEYDSLMHELVLKVGGVTATLPSAENSVYTTTQPYSQSVMHVPKTSSVFLTVCIGTALSLTRFQEMHVTAQ